MDGIVIREPQIVDMDLIFANDYNPNRMPMTEMSLLEQCILKYGFLFPLIVTWIEEVGKYRIIDGFHRYEKLKQLGAKKVSVIELGGTLGSSL